MPSFAQLSVEVFEGSLRIKAGPGAAEALVKFEPTPTDPTAGDLELVPGTSFQGQFSGDLSGFAWASGDLDISDGVNTEMISITAATPSAADFAAGLQQGLRGVTDINLKAIFQTARVINFSDSLGVTRLLVAAGAPGQVFTFSIISNPASTLAADLGFQQGGTVFVGGAITAQLGRAHV